MKRRALLLDRLVTRLDLTLEQKVDVEKIIEDTQMELMKFRRTLRPEMLKIMEKRFSLIREKLDEEQQEKLDEIQEQMKHRLGRRRGGLRPFKGGP